MRAKRHCRRSRRSVQRRCQTSATVFGALPAFTMDDQRHACRQGLQAGRPQDRLLQPPHLGRVLRACTYVYDRTLYDIAAPCPLAAFAEPKIEPEIMLGLSRAPSPGMHDAALLSCIAWVAHGFEIVQSIFPGWKFAPPDAVIVDGHHAALLIGPRNEIGAKARNGSARSPASRSSSFATAGSWTRGTR